jgi:hypothetical protein
MSRHTPWAAMGHNRPSRPLSEVRESGVTFNHELPTGHTDEFNGSGVPLAGNSLETTQ